MVSPLKGILFNKIQLVKIWRAVLIKVILDIQPLTIVLLYKNTGNYKE